MITSMHIENFKCFKEFDIELGSFNVLIGPNDTGKTAFLQAVRLIGGYSEMPDWKEAGPALAEIAGASPASTASYQRNIDSPIVIAATCRGIGRPALLEIAMPSGLVLGYKSVVIGGKEEAVIPLEKERMPHPEYYRLSPFFLRTPCPLAREMGETGEGFTAFLDNINRDDPDAFKGLQEDFCNRFPHYTRFEIAVVKHRSQSLLALKFRTKAGQVLDSSLVSDGVVLSLAFMALAHRANQPRILLIEEPENGVHHASLKDIVKTLLHLSFGKMVQVILTTHSPYLVDEVEPSMVHVFQKGDEGAVHAKKLSDFEGAGEISDMFSTGEKWSLLAEKYGI